MNGVLEKQWLWRGQLQPVAEFDGAGNLVARFVYSGGVNVPSLMITSMATYKLVRDTLGSVRFVVDASTGAIAQELRYDAWGRVLIDTSPSFQPFGFAGGLYDVDTGLVRFGAQDYEAESGRWTAKDPGRFRGGVNLFAYALSNPVGVTDPTGNVPRLEANWPGIGPRSNTSVTQCCAAAQYAGPFGDVLPPHCWVCAGSFCAGLSGTFTDTEIELHNSTFTSHDDGA